MKKIKPVIIQDEEKEIPYEIMAEEIVKISKAMEILNNSRLKRSAIVTLIWHQSKVKRRDIEVVMNNLQDLASDYLK